MAKLRPEEGGAGQELRVQGRVQTKTTAPAKAAGRQAQGSEPWKGGTFGLAQRQIEGDSGGLTAQRRHDKQGPRRQ